MTSAAGMPCPVRRVSLVISERQGGSYSAERLRSQEHGME